jgi:hypothetical protein
MLAVLCMCLFLFVIFSLFNILFSNYYDNDVIHTFKLSLDKISRQTSPKMTIQ